MLDAGGGLLPLLAAEAGASSVAAVHRSRMLYRMAKQCLDSNVEEHAETAGRVRLLDRRLQSVGVVGEAPPPDALLAAEVQQAQQEQAKGQGRSSSPDSVAAAAPGEASGSSDASAAADSGACALLPRRAQVLVTDLLDHSVLGMGLLPALDYAAQRLLAPGALVVPQRVQVGLMGGGGWEGSC